MDFALALSSSFMPMMVTVYAIAHPSSAGKKKDKNPFGLSNKAYQITIDIACSRLQVLPAPAAVANSVLPLVHSTLANPAS